MKRFLFAMALAAAAVLATESKAPAWCNFNFSAGLNTPFQCGGTRIGQKGFYETSNGPAGPQWPHSQCQQPWQYQAQPQCIEPWMPPADLKPLVEPKPKEEPKPTPKSWLEDVPPLPVPVPTAQPIQQMHYNYYPQYQGYAVPAYWYRQ